MQNVRFLGLSEVIAINQDQINRHGGLHGIRSYELLESAVYEPQASFDAEYLHKDMAEMAACYLFGIVKNHPFLDGNKRTGIICAFLFLHYNDIHILVSQKVFYNLAMDIAASKIDKEAVIAFFTDRIK